MDLSLDGVYRAVSRGLLVGSLSTVAFLVIKTVFSPAGLQPISALAAFLTFTMLATGMAFYKDTLKLPLRRKAVLITGCDSGFGYELALRLERMGAIVFAGCLSTQQGGGSELKSLGLKNLHVIELNVTSEEQVAAAVEYVNRNLTPKGLWGIVNNAGLSTFGHVEWVPLSTCRKLMEVNVWGMIRVTQAFLPMLRQSKGRVVNMASGLGRFCLPNRSTYGISKYGVEALSDCLRYEMKHWGVSVSVIEPGNFVNATGIFTADTIQKEADALWEQIPEPVQKDYTKAFYDNIINNMIKYSTVGTTDKTPVLDAYTLALVHRYPHPRYQPMELKMKLMSWVNTHLPEWVYEKLFL